MTNSIMYGLTNEQLIIFLDVYDILSKRLHEIEHNNSTFKINYENMVLYGACIIFIIILVSFKIYKINKRTIS